MMHTTITKSIKSQQYIERSYLGRPDNSTISGPGPGSGPGPSAAAARCAVALSGPGPDPDAGPGLEIFELSGCPRYSVPDNKKKTKTH